MEAIELAVEARLLNGHSHYEYSIRVTTSQADSEFSEALFPSYLQAGYHINCVPDVSWVYCNEVFKATWPEELSDKCVAVICVCNKELHN